MRLPKQNKSRKIKHDKDLYPLGILDIIERDYPDRYIDLSEDPEMFFSRDEWLDILTRSRISYEQWNKLKGLSRGRGF